MYKIKVFIFINFRGAEASSSGGTRGTPPKMSKKQSKPGEAPPAPKTSAVKSSVPTVPKAWHETHSFLSKNLEAHSDLVSCVDMKDDYIISGRFACLIFCFNLLQFF